MKVMAMASSSAESAIVQQVAPWVKIAEITFTGGATGFPVNVK
jgi:hypothetical protein